LMKTLAVICIALTRQNPSLIPDFCKAFSTSGVMLTKPKRSGILNQSSSL
jgi:hypothetical protein